MGKKHDILTKTMWFERRLLFDLEDIYQLLEPARSVVLKPKYKGREFYSEKCQRWVRCESGTEYKFFQFLEHSKKVKWYIEQPVTIPFYHGRKRLPYTPDAGIYLSNNEFLIAEVKHLRDMLDDHVQCKIEGLMGYCSSKGFGMLFTDGSHTFMDLKKIKLNRRLEKGILMALDNGPIRLRDYREIKQLCGSTHNELLRVILKHDLRFNSDHFKLRHGGYNTMFREVFLKGKKYDDLILSNFIGSGEYF